MALATGQLRRSMRLLALPASGVALGVEGRLRRWRGEDPAAVRRDLRARGAARTRRTLGDLKGGALKAGQLVSTVEALLPQDPEDTWRGAVVGLQEQAGALPFAEVEPVLAAELGAGWRERFRTFEETAVAAASLGQVHRGTWVDGRDVAVKVQYPGVREALAADLRTLAAVTRLAGLVARGLVVPPLVAEMRQRLAEELDYLHEGEAQELFACWYDENPDILVPHVVHATSRVLVSEWLPGTPLAQVAATGSQAERDAAAAAYQLFLVSGPARTGRLHTDPHPGNFRVLADGRLGVIDFGSTLGLPDGMPASFGGLLRVLLGGTDAEVLAGLRAGGFVRPGARLPVAELRAVLAPFAEPAGHAEFRFSREWLRGQFARGQAGPGDPRDPDPMVAAQLTLPAEHLFTHRVWLGMVGVLCQLEATVPVRPVLERWLPGFAEPAAPGP